MNGNERSNKYMRVNKDYADLTLINSPSSAFLWCTHDGPGDNSRLLNGYKQNRSVWDAKQDFLSPFFMPLQGQTNISLDVWGQLDHSDPFLVGMPERSEHVVRNWWDYQARCWSQHPIYTQPQGLLMPWVHRISILHGAKKIFPPKRCKSAEWTPASLKIMQSVERHVSTLPVYTQHKVIMM